jgi:hypothetical protein
MTLGRRRFRRDRHGRYHPGLSAEERTLLAGLPAQAIELMEQEDASTRRLFPAAYPDDAEAEKEYRGIMGESLVARHRHTLEALAEGASAQTLGLDELEQWMGGLEVLRLVLGTQLEVREDMDRIDPDDPRVPGFALYTWLSLLQEEVVEALTDAMAVGGHD